MVHEDTTWEGGTINQCWPHPTKNQLPTQSRGSNHAPQTAFNPKGSSESFLRLSVHLTANNFMKSLLLGIFYHALATHSFVKWREHLSS